MTLNPLQRRERADRLLKHRSVSRKADRWLELIAFDGVPWDEAADAVGLRRKLARHMLGSVVIQQEIKRRCEVLRAGERGVNMHTLREIRDRAREPLATAAQQTASIKAVQVLEGQDSGGSITIHGNVGQVAGYVINLEGESEGPVMLHQRQDHAKPLIEHDDGGE